MSLNFISSDTQPTYTAISTDIVNSAIEGASIVGSTVLIVDTGNWYIVEDDLTLSPFNVPTSVSSLPLPTGAATSDNQINGNQIAKILFDPSNMSAFGSLETAELTPVIQVDFVYGLNTQVWNTPVVSGAGATVDTNATRLRLQSGTANGGYAYITTRRPIRYRAGQGTVSRFTPLFTTGVENNVQLWGMGTITSNAPYDGYFFGYNGTSFGIAHYNAGTPTWYSQSADWNSDKCNGSSGTAFNFNPIFGTPAMIKYPYLGYGDIEFFLQNPLTGRWVLVHVIRYANTTATTQLSNPTLQYLGYTKNSAVVLNRIMYCGSVGVFISGTRSFIANPKWAADSIKSGITGETSILGIKNCTTYNGFTNRGLLRLKSLSVSVTSAQASVAILRFRINATLGGSPSYTPVNGTPTDSGVASILTAANSIASFDVAATTSSAGTYIFNVNVTSGQNGQGGTFVDLTPFEIFVAPSEILTIGAVCQNASAIGVSLNWSEDI